VDRGDYEEDGAGKDKEGATGTNDRSRPAPLYRAIEIIA
jgi:hypothetical protein